MALLLLLLFLFLFALQQSYAIDDSNDDDNPLQRTQGTEYFTNTGGISLSSTGMMTVDDGDGDGEEEREEEEQGEDGDQFIKERDLFRKLSTLGLHASVRRESIVPQNSPRVYAPLAAGTPTAAADGGSIGDDYRSDKNVDGFDDRSDVSTGLLRMFRLQRGWAPQRRRPRRGSVRHLRRRRNGIRAAAIDIRRQRIGRWSYIA